MKNILKNKMVFIVLIILFLIFFFFLMLFLKKEPVKKQNANEKIKNTSQIDNSKKNNKKESINKEKENNSSNKTDNTEEVKNVPITNESTNSQIDINHNVPGTPSYNEPVVNSTPVITYSCPDGYSLNNDKCISIVNSQHVCPENTYEYTLDKYCIKFSEGYVTETQTCPEGYGVLRISGWGQDEDKYECYPLHEMIYVCPDEYSLNTSNQCSRVIDANINYN